MLALFNHFVNHLIHQLGITLYSGKKPALVPQVYEMGLTLQEACSQT